jgi:hypothetical protein
MTEARSWGWRLAKRPVLARVLVLVLVAAFSGSVGSAGRAAEAPVGLCETVRRGSSTRVAIELKAQGLFRPGLPPGGTSAESRMPKPLALEIQTRLIFIERVVQVGANEAVQAGRVDRAKTKVTKPAAAGRPLKAVRHVIQAASAINGEVRPTAASIRPEVAILVAERRNHQGPVAVVSAAGPLTRSELELVQGVGDPLALADLLPADPVVIGDHWRVGDAAAQAVSGYDVLTSNTLDAVLESSDLDRARVRLKGEIQGSALGGSGTMTCEGFLTFDRQAGRVDRLDLNRNETRRPGPIEAGLDVKSTLTVIRNAVEPPATLSNAALAELPLEITPQRELLRLTTPGGKAILLHDRHWHSFWDDPKLTVLKRLDGGQVIAQCNLAVGPPAGKGRHQDHNQFRDDIRRALKERFGHFLGAGLVDGDPAGGFRYKVGVQGREGQLGVVWYYYLLAGPEGDQLLATFTLAADHVKALGDQDLEMIGSLQWSGPSQPAPGG